MYSRRLLTCFISLAYFCEMFSCECLCVCLSQWVSPHASDCDDFADVAVALEAARWCGTSVEETWLPTTEKTVEYLWANKDSGTTPSNSFHFTSFHLAPAAKHTHTHTIQYSSSMLVYSIEHLRMRATQFNRSDKFAQQTIHEFSQKIRKVQRMANDRSMAAHAHVAIFLRIWKTATNMKTTTLLTNNSV